MAPRPRCPICRSKKWHRDQLSGSIVCEEGHLLSGYVQESIEQDQPSQHFLTTRRDRKGRRGDPNRPSKPPSNDYFHGDRATYLVFQSLQFILREQLRCLIDDFGYPVELESIGKDLWTMYCASSMLPSAPIDFEKGQETGKSYSGPRSGDRYTKRGRTKYGPRGGGGSSSVKGKGKGKGRAKKEDDDEEDEEEGGEDEEMRGERATSQEREESSEDEGESSPSSYFSEGDADDERPRPGSRSRKTSPDLPPLPSSSSTNPKLNAYAPPKPRPPVRGTTNRMNLDPRSHPRIDFLLLIIYLACVTLRLPIFLSDIYRLAETYQILYLDAVLHLPLEMQLHLSSSNRNLLSPKSVPPLYPTTSPSTFDEHSSQAWLSRLVKMYRQDWGIEFPEVNQPLVVGRVCRLLALPPIAHILIQRILSLLPQPISFHLSTQLTSTTRRDRDRNGFETLSPKNQEAALRNSLKGLRKKGLPKEFQWKSYSSRSSNGSRSGRSKKKIPEIEGEEGGDNGRMVGHHDWRMILPEFKIVTVAIVVCKLLWNLGGEEGSSIERGGGGGKRDGGNDDGRDDHETFDTFLEEFIDDLPNVEDWLRTVEEIAKLEKPGDPSHLWSKEVVDMEENEIDAYLDFFEDKIVSKTKVPKRIDDLGRFFPEPINPTRTNASTTPTSYIERIDRLISNLYTSRTQTDDGMTAFPPDFPSHPSSQSIPPQISRLVVAISSHLLPLPTSLPVALQGSAPNLVTTSSRYLLPQVSYIEQLLSYHSIPIQRQMLQESRKEEKELWKEAQTLAGDFSRELWKEEVERRKRIERVLKERREEERKERKEWRERNPGVKRRKGNSSRKKVKKRIVVPVDDDDDDADREDEDGDLEMRQAVVVEPVKSKNEIGDSSEEEVEQEIQKELKEMRRKNARRKQVHRSDSGDDDDTTSSDGGSLDEDDYQTSDGGSRRASHRRR